MAFIRAVAMSDLEQLVGLAASASKGLTTLPPDRDFLKARIAKSEQAFASMQDERAGEYYMLVLVDETSEGIIGVSGVFATVGLDKPFYNYKVLNISQQPSTVDMRVDTALLTLVNDYSGASELASLFLHEEHRGGGNGKLLSKARFMLIAAFPERFAPTVMAELRGWVDHTDESPFWNALGQHFFNMSLHDADRINGLGDSQFIADLMPKYPIYTNLLPEGAQHVIGKPHDEGIPAMRLLESEGFRFRGAVDIFDAGPCVEASRDQIRAVRDCRNVSIKAGHVSRTDAYYMIALSDPFKVISARARREGPNIIVDNQDLIRLGIDEGANVRAVAMDKEVYD